jgi:hypothetical protein
MRLNDATLISSPRQEPESIVGGDDRRKLGWISACAGMTRTEVNRKL